MHAGTAGKVLEYLGGYGLKHEGGNNYRSNSPLRPGSNSHAFTLTIHGDEYGAYHDKVTDEGGSLYDLAQKLGIALPEREKPEDTKRAYTGLADYASAHGLPVETLTAAGWVETTHKGRPALKYPTASGNRVRFLDDQKPHYINELKGYSPCWYGLKRAFDMGAGVVVLCNGEISTITGQFYKVPAFAHTGGESSVKGELIQELRALKPKRVIIAFDCDEAGRRGAAKVAAQIPDLNPVIVDLGFGTGGDLADFCKLHQADSFAALLKLADEAASVQSAQASAVPSDVELLAGSVNELASAIRADKRAQENADLEVLTARVQAELDRVKMHSSKPMIISFREIVEHNAAEVQYRMMNQDVTFGLRSKIPALDGLFGGFEPEVYTFLGATNMGKSTLVTTLAAALLDQAPGLIVPTESNPSRWLNKLVAALTGIPSHLIEKGKLSQKQWAVVKETYKRLESMGCQMIKHGSPSVSMIRPVLLHGVKEFGFEWCIVDSGSKMEHPGATTIYDITRGVYNGLQSLMQEANVPIFVTCQISREIADRPKGQKRPRIDDAYGGAVIEQNSGAVFGLYNHDYYVRAGLEYEDPNIPRGTALLSLLKSRWTPLTADDSILLKFIGGVKFEQAA